MEKPTSQTTRPQVDGDIIANPPELATATSIDLELKEVVKGADAALAYANQTAIELDDATNQRILRKIDLRVLPWLCALYFLQYLDKGILNYAGVMGIKTDTHLSTKDYSWLGSIYYIGYLVAIIPHNQILQKMAPSKYIAICMTLWGIVTMTMAACKNFPQLMVQRFFLGILESVVNCGFVLITARWYRKYEHAGRVAIWGSCNGLAICIGGLIAYGCLAGQESNPNTALVSWRILALCLGAVSVIFGSSMWYFLPSSIVTARFFSEEDKTLAIERLRENHQGIGSSQFKWYQAKEAILDIRTWLYTLYVLTAQIPAGGLVLLSSILIESLDYDSKTTLLLAMPSGALQVILQVGLGYVADKTKQRTIVAISIQMVSLFGVCLLVGLGQVGLLYDRVGQLIAYFLMMGSCAIGYYIIISMVSSNVLGTTKKTTTSAILFIAVGLAYVLGPQMFLDPPGYEKAKMASIGLWCAAVLILVIIYFLNLWENKKRDREFAQSGSIPAPSGIEFMDLTDKENKWFRYSM